MSYDLQLWSVLPVQVPDDLPTDFKWSRSGDFWSTAHAGWQLVVTGSARVFPEDVPDEIFRALPGISYLTYLHLSPFSAATAAREKQQRVASHLARLRHGLILDPQTAALTTARGVKRYVPIRPTEDRASVVQLSWWFMDGPLPQGAVSGFLDVFFSVLPEAVPRRYGLWEPPQHVLAETGREGFEQFLVQNLRAGIVWYPNRPVVDVHLGIPPQMGWWTPDMFRCVYVTISVDSAVLSQPGWETALKVAWRRISHAVHPFYGDVRTLRGYHRDRGSWGEDGDTESHAVTAWWWAGLPPGPAQAIVLGEPYLAHWPRFQEAATTDGSLSLVTASDWSSSDDVSLLVGHPPDELMQQGGKPRRFPLVWPFEPRPR